MECIGDTEGLTEGLVIEGEGGNLPRYVHRKSGSYDYAKELFRNAYGWIKDNGDYLKTQIPVYGDYQRVDDDSQFWKDYKKNTGFTARYPTRVYGHSVSYALSSTSRLFRNVKRLYG